MTTGPDATADNAGPDNAGPENARPENARPASARAAVDDFAAWARPSLLAMTRLAARLAPSADVDDVVQDALTRAWRKRRQFDPDRGTPTTWLLAIVADQARTHRRGSVRRLRLIDEDADPPDIPTEQQEPDLDLDAAIIRLTRRQQLAVQLHYFLGLTVDETAQTMACSPGTVKSTLFDARARLRTLLGDDDAH